jgi:hypothetical protein
VKPNHNAENAYAKIAARWSCAAGQSSTFKESNMKKQTHNFRVGDVVESRKTGGRYVVSGTKGWLHGSFIHAEGKLKGKRDSWISLVKEIGATSLLTHASEYRLVLPREKVGKRWWAIFPKGEK